MSESSERLERYLTDVEGCRAAELDDRLGELDDLEALAAERAGTDVPVLSALASETRYGLVRALVAAGEPLCVCELRPMFAVSESAVSHALSDLAAVGLVDRSEEGRWHYYEATDRAAALLAALDETRDET